MPGRAEREAEQEAEEKAAAQDSQGGVFNRGSTFQRGEEPTGPASNPVIIRQEDPARGVPAAELAQGRNQPVSLTDRKLVCVWDAQGNPQVAEVVNNRQQEHFRPPTREEWERLSAGGRFIKGGLSGGETAVDVTPKPDEGFPWKKVIAALGIIGAIWAWKNWDTVQGWYESMFPEEGEEEVVE